MGVQAVLEALSSRYIKQLLAVKAHQLSRKHGFQPAERADMVQELTMHVLKQAHHYDPARAGVNTFIDRVVNSAAAMLIRDRGRLKRGRSRAMSLERTKVNGHYARRATLAQTVGESDLRRRCGGQIGDDRLHAELVIDFSRVLSALTPQQRDIALRRINASELAIAKDLGISRRQVGNAIEALREQLMKAGFQDF